MKIEFNEDEQDILELMSTAEYRSDGIGGSYFRDSNDTIGDHVGTRYPYIKEQLRIGVDSLVNYNLAYLSHGLLIIPNSTMNLYRIFKEQRDEHSKN